MLSEFKVAGVTYRVNPDGGIEVQDLNGQWQPWDASRAASPGTAQAIRQAAQAAKPSGGPTTTGGTLAKIATAQGEGWSVTGKPTQALDDAGGPIPNTYTVVLSGPAGAQRIATVTAPAGLGPTDARILAPDTVDWTVTNIAEPVKPTKTAAETNAEIATAQANLKNAETQAKEAQARLDQIQTDNRNRDTNAANTGLWVTDKEKADIQARGAEQKLTQQQIDNQLKIASDNNRVAQTQNEISALNAATTAFTARSNAEAQEARTRFEQGQLDETVAQNAFTRSQQQITSRLAQDKLELDRLTQRQTNETAQATLAQRAEEAQQTATTAALGQGAQAAGTVYSAERTAQQEAARTGAGILQQRATTFQNLSQAPFTQAGNLSQGSAGRYGMLGGGLHAVPEGAVGNILQGAYGTSAALMGGQSTLQAAQQAIENIRPGATLTPQGQAALGVLSQMFERTQDLLKNQQAGAGIRSPAATITPTQAAAAAPAAKSFVSPLTTTPPGTNVNQVAGFNTLGPVAGTPGTGGPNAFTAPPAAPFAGQDIQQLMRQQMQSHAAPPPPTININL